MVRRVVECIPNFSEGRDAGKVNAIAEAIARGPNVAVLGVSMDADHNRSVITFAGSPEAVADAAMRAVSKATDLIDLNGHTGVHPRIGATDVLPFVPISGVTMEDCVAIAHAVGEEIWKKHTIPVYFYEHAASKPEGKRLENIRRGHFAPDIGGPGRHPTAGATVVGAREFLIAYNINLETESVSVAKNIAQTIRESSGGFPCVKALGLPLATRKQCQVSMNLTNFRTTPPHVVYDAVRALAEKQGVAIAGSELIGLIPKAAIEMAAEHFLKFENFAPQLVLESRLEELLPFTLDDVLDEMSDPTRSVGGGSAAAFAGAMAAALGLLTMRLNKSDPSMFAEHRRFFRAAANRDAEAFAALMRTPEPDQDAIVEATEIPLAIGERASILARDLDQHCAGVSDRFRSDVTTAMGLAKAAQTGAMATFEVNLPRVSNSAIRDELSLRAAKLK
ncbi:MAG TPA: glutamate formimidoyltransferase [Bryobacteraceae bacterium]|nr:glutamate formimidoyltransferase [Bryobacteraceae bacterium]